METGGVSCKVEKEALCSASKVPVLATEMLALGASIYPRVFPEPSLVLGEESPHTLNVLVVP